MSRARALAIGILGLAGVCGGAPASAAPNERPKILPYLDIEQVSEAQISGGGSGVDDFVTYTEITAGVTAEANTRRIKATVNYAYTRRVSEAGRTINDSSHNGLARVQIALVEDLLSLEGGAIATYSRVNPGGSAAIGNIATANNLTQVFSYYASPSLNRKIGDLNVAANYRYGYTTTKNNSRSLIPGAGFNEFQNSTGHQATTSVGMKDGDLPFNWTITSQYIYERASQLDQHYRAYSSTAEIVVPIAETVAFVGSGGYENIRTTQQPLLVDAADVPVLDSNGRTQGDPNAPRTLTYDTNGLIGDGGLIWEPTRRARFELRGGWRYDSVTFSGLAEVKPDAQTSLTLIAFDRVDSFGRGLSQGLAATPVNFQTGNQGNDSAYQDCVFGKTPDQRASCLGGSLGSAAAANYRNRGLTFVYSHQMRGSTIRLSGGYQHRTYIDDPLSPLSLDGVVDQSVFVQAGYSRLLARNSGVDFSLTGNLFMNGQPGQPDVSSINLDGNYYRTFGRGLRAQATVGLEASKQDGTTADVSGRARLGVRYDF
jgi:hypothetical protein